MRAGRLRHRITIQRREQNYDDLGHEQGDWKTIAAGHPALVEDLSGRELERYRQIVAEVTTRITTRRSAANFKDRILFRGRILNVLSETYNEIETEQEILCAEVLQG